MAADIFRRQAVLFDLDGTLTDPAEGITRSVQYALRQMGRAVPGQGRRCFPLSVRRCWIPSGNSAAWSRPRRRRRCIIIARIFSRQGIWENRVYPGIPELLCFLKEQGRTLILATSKPAVFAGGKFWSALNWLRIFPCSPAVSWTAPAASRTRWSPGRWSGPVFRRRRP